MTESRPRQKIYKFMRFEECIVPLRSGSQTVGVSATLNEDKKRLSGTKSKSKKKTISKFGPTVKLGSKTPWIRFNL